MNTFCRRIFFENDQLNRGQCISRRSVLFCRRILRQAPSLWFPTSAKPPKRLMSLWNAIAVGLSNPYLLISKGFSGRWNNPQGTVSFPCSDPKEREFSTCFSRILIHRLIIQNIPIVQTSKSKFYSPLLVTHEYSASPFAHNYSTPFMARPRNAASRKCGNRRKRLSCRSPQISLQQSFAVTGYQTAKTVLKARIYVRVQR